mmetsp:Transcript_2306/g.2252  ORF Transcript_2306/g.2252 Transcript_2306/m.2252 type:complete len:81 (-) Transcript_2306:84-326(-)
MREAQVNNRQRRNRNRFKNQNRQELEQEPEPDDNPLIDENAMQKNFMMQFGSLKILLAMVLFFSLFLHVISMVGYSQTHF